MRPFILSLLVVFFCVSTYGQKGTLTGIVVGKKENEILPLAYIKLSSDKKVYESETNYNGEFNFKKLPFGTYKLTTHAESFYYRLDTMIQFSDTTKYLKLHLHSYDTFQFPNEDRIEFTFWDSPASGVSFSYHITRDSITLNELLLFNFKQSDTSKRRVERNQYVHKLTKHQQKKFDEIVEVHQLDSVALYENRITFSCYVWEIEIEKSYTTFNIELPCYHNQGLEEMLEFAASTIPKRKKNRFSR